MSTQHTPGPWKAVRNASFWEVVTPAPGQTLDQADEYSQSIAYVWGQGEEQAVANARLIAAAPELLEALQNLLTYPLETFQVKAAKAAINKATGQ